ncbi:MAG: hypothetical protein E2O61_07650 [Gammaproteobacteria bacterium]|nr:MAG: hypothetical protein E2O61_07650 [Gammaproteobacteria bacterium]
MNGNFWTRSKLSFVAMEAIRTTQIGTTLLGVAVLAHLTASVFSTGFYHPDEHFHILEFLGARLGWSNEVDLPWEWPLQIRPALPLAWAALIAQALKLVNALDPFLLAWLLRLSAAVLGLAASLSLYRCVERDFPNSRLIWLWTCLLWVLPIVHARFIVDNLASSLFVLGVTRLLAADRTTIGGLLMATALVLRPHMLPMVAGFLGWWLFQDRARLRKIIPIGVACLVVLAAEVTAGKWLYGTWTFSSWNYLQAILSGRMDDFGSVPWWGYLQIMMDDVLPPFNVLFIAAVAFFAIRYPKHWVTWSVLPFLLVHVFISMKHLRFLFPLAIFLPVLLVSLDHARMKLANKLLVGLSVMVLLGVVFLPLDRSPGLFRFVNERFPDGLTLYTLGWNPYERVGLPMNFYNKVVVNVQIVSSPGDLQVGEYYLFHRRYQIPEPFQDQRCEVLYSSLPNWIGRFDFNGWLSRAEIWRVYRCRKP